MIRHTQCRCGKLSVEAEGEPQGVSACHCMECQRRTGSALGMAAFYDKTRVRPSGPGARYTRSGDEGRAVTFHFCPNCGTTLYWEAEAKPESLGIAVGCFTDPGFPAPTRSVFEHRKQQWLELPVHLARPW